MMSPPRNILIVRLSAIGDVVMASALIPAIKNTWPDARLSWLVEPAGYDLLRHNPRLDEVIVWPRPYWRQLWQQRQFGRWFGEVHRFTTGLRRRRFDQVIDIQGLLKSGLWARLTGARQRIGLGSREGSQYLMTRRVDRYGGDDRIGSEYLHLAKTLELDTGAFRMDVAVGEQPAVMARNRIAKAGIDRYAVICPFTTRPQKHWFEDRWQTLTGLLSAQTGLPVVMLGGPGDRTAGERIADGCQLLNLTGQTRLDETAALIDGASLLVGVDTGLTHLGIARDVPTIALFGSTRPYLNPASDRATVLYHPLVCSPCRRPPICDGRFDCMRLHTPDNVMAAVQTLLAQS